MIMPNSRANKFHDGSVNSSENTMVQDEAGRLAGRRVTPLRFHSAVLPNRGTCASARSGWDPMTGSWSSNALLGSGFGCSSLNCRTPRSPT